MERILRKAETNISVTDISVVGRRRLRMKEVVRIERI